MDTVTQGQWPGFCRDPRKLCQLLRSSDARVVGGRERKSGTAGLASLEAGRMVPTRFWESKGHGIVGKRHLHISFLLSSPGLLRRN